MRRGIVQLSAHDLCCALGAYIYSGECVLGAVGPQRAGRLSQVCESDVWCGVSKYHETGKCRSNAGVRVASRGALSPLGPVRASRC